MNTEQLKLLFEFNRQVNNATHVGIGGNIYPILSKTTLEEEFDFDELLRDNDVQELHQIPVEQLTDFLEIDDLTCCMIFFAESGYDEFAEDTMINYADLFDDKIDIELYELKKTFQKVDR